MRQLTLHLTQGVLTPSLSEAKAMHNAFTDGGPQPGIEIARALGDVAHNVLTPARNVTNPLAAEPDQLLFIDHWADPEGMETFFANPAAQQAGDLLFSAREEMEWAAVPGGFAFNVPAPHGLRPDYLVMTRLSVTSAGEATAALGKDMSARLAAARRCGQLSHALFVRHAGNAAIRPAANARQANGRPIIQPQPTVEILTLDWWSTLDGLPEHYDDPATQSVWQLEEGFTAW